MNNSNKQQDSQWTDELVKQFIKEGICIGQSTEDAIEKFIKSKQQPIVERIQCLSFEKDFNYSFGAAKYVLNISETIPKEKHEAVKQAIEKVLNNETIVAKSDGKGGYSIPDEELAKLKIPTIERQKGQITILEALEVINEDDWEEARKKLNEILDAKQSPKEEQKPILFTTEDGVDVKQGDRIILLSTINWFKVEMTAPNCKEPFKGETGSEFKYFWNKSAVELYILENKPCLSAKDVYSITTKYGVDAVAIKKEIEKLANTKINKQ